MAGTAGSSFADELNRLANGGTYPALTAYKSEQGAANAYASTNGLGIIAALNIKASASRQPKDYKMLNAICNELAGTTGLSAIDALRTI
jgi:hypothetical protein